MSSSNRAELKRYILEKRILLARLEISLYALPDDFTVYVDNEQQPLLEPHRVTRNRKAYEASSSRYGQLVSPTKMYNIIKRHMKYETMQLWRLEASHGKPVHIKDNKLTRYAVILGQLRVGRGKNMVLELQPRWVRRSDDEDELYEEAVSLVARTQIADATLIRDNLSIGQTQANAFMQRLEDEGLVSELSKSAHRRSVYITVDDMDTREAIKHADK